MNAELTTSHYLLLAKIAKTKLVPDTSKPHVKDRFYDLVDAGFVVIEGLGFISVTKAGKAALKKSGV